MPTIQLPHKYTPRPYQLPMLKARDEGVSRIIEIWHRRAGKDKSLINMVAKEMMRRVGSYFYFFPTYQQGRKILWEGMDRSGFKFLDHIPKELRVRTNDTEMLIELKNGSIFRVVGTDRIDSIVGTNPIGCVFSEYALQNPQAWAFIRPILQENGGWAVFNYTPRGDNHGKTLYEAALKRDDWRVELLTALDTGVFTPEQLEQEKRELIEEYGEAEGLALFEQEYMCNFDTPVIGSYYGAQLQRAKAEGRIGNVPHDPILPVDTFWDLGVNDTTSIWFLQTYGQEVRVIDYYENSGEGLPHYAKILQQKGYTYGRHYGPHDIKVRELGTGKSRLETAQSLGINFEVVPNIALEDGIEATRNFLSKCWFDETKCERGLAGLKNYHKEYDDKKKVYKDRPYHDWSSNPSDAFRYAAVGHRQSEPVVPSAPRKYDPLTGRVIS